MTRENLFLIHEGDGSRAGNSRAGDQTSFLPEIIAGGILRYFWTGPNEAHLTAQNIPELRNFVNFGAAQKPAEFGDARVVCCRDSSAVCRLVPNHGAKFKYAEGFAQATSAFLAKKNRARTREANQDRRGQKNREGHKKPQSGEGGVEPFLAKQVIECAIQVLLQCTAAILCPIRL